MSKLLDCVFMAAASAVIFIIVNGGVVLADNPFDTPEPVEVVGLLGMGGVVLIGMLWRRSRRIQ
jgi:hypothetical protein